MRVWLLAALALLTSVTAARSARSVALVGGTLYAEPAAAPLKDAAVLIQDGRIVAVGRRSDVDIPAGADVLDCTGRFITAGFWNSHVHIFTPALLHAAGASSADLQRELDGMLNRWGFTTVFDVASVLDNTLALRRRIDDGDVKGPRIFTVGEPLWTRPPAYVRDFIEAQHIAIETVASPADAVRLVRGLSARGADGVKLFTGSLQRGSVSNMPLAIARAAVTEAHRRHLPVFAHPQNAEGLEVAIGAGVDILAHTAPDSPDWTPGFVSRLVRKRLALIPTLTLFDFEARNGAVADREREAWLRKMVGELRAFRAGGGEVLFGTDVGYTTHVDTTLEFELMREAGMDATAILASMTTNPAAQFTHSRGGAVKPGYDGDLVILDGDPWADVRNFARVRTTIRSGTVVFQSR